MLSVAFSIVGFFNGKSMFTIDLSGTWALTLLHPIVKVGGNFATDFVGNRLRLLPRTNISAFKVLNQKM